MKIQKLVYLFLMLMVSGCCCNKAKPEINHVLPNIKTLFPYKNGEVLRFRDSVTNNKITVSCTTNSTFWVAGCEVLQCTNCQDFEFEEFKITLLSPDSNFYMSILTRSGGVDTSFIFQSKDSYNSMLLKVDRSNNLMCYASDNLRCGKIDTLENLNIKNIFQIMGNPTPKGDSITNLKKVWVTKNEGIVKVRFKNTTFYLDR
jgi:hypothetical protein